MLILTEISYLLVGCALTLSRVYVPTFSAMRTQFPSYSTLTATTVHLIIALPRNAIV